MGIKLKEPPIVEVVCGFFFEPVQGLDALLVGKFWSERSDRFPKRSLQPIVTELPGPIITAGAAPVRSWLLSDDEAYLLQIQPDRLYFNWRRRGDAAPYPSFSDHDGKPGVLRRSLAELGEFRAFCLRELSRDLRIGRVELVKQDMLFFGKHHQGVSDLAQGVPLLGPIYGFAKADDPLINVVVVDQRDGVDVRLQIASGSELASGEAGLQLETRTTKMVGGDLESELRDLNRVANDVFFGLIHPDWLSRFGGVEP